MEQFDRDLWFGAEGQLRGHTDLLTHLLHLLTKPVLRNEQLAINKGVAFVRGITDKDADLTGGDFAERATVLMGDSSGVLTLFGHARFVDKENAIVSVSKRASEEALVLSKNRKSGPGALSQKGLHLPYGDAQGQRDRFARFARKDSEQALEVTRRPGMLIETGKGVQEVLDISLQCRQQGLDIAHGQVALWQRAGRCYNSVVHGLLPQST